MKELLFAAGMFIDRQFDKIVLLVILFATLYRADNSGALAREIAFGAFSGLMGFMQGRASVKKDEPGVK